MFKYLKFNKVKDEFTTYSFTSSDDKVSVNFFSGTSEDIVSIQADNEVHLDALILAQASIINVREITKEEFKAIATDSCQINRIRDIVKKEIAKKYLPADEIAMLKKDLSNGKRVVYDAYVADCILLGDKLKSEIGY